MRCRNADGSECGNTHTTFRDGYCHVHRDQVPAHGMVVVDETFRQEKLMHVPHTHNLTEVRRIIAQHFGKEE